MVGDWIEELETFEERVARRQLVTREGLAAKKSRQGHDGGGAAGDDAGDEAMDDAVRQLSSGAFNENTSALAALLPLPSGHMTSSMLQRTR